MSSPIQPVLNAIDSILEWLGSTLSQTASSYCHLETAYNKTTLVGRDGSLVSVLKLNGAQFLVGPSEFQQLFEGVNLSFLSALSHRGHAIQVVFNYDKDRVSHDLKEILRPAEETAKRLNLKLDDLFRERIAYMPRYCAKEDVFIILWTRPSALSKQQNDISRKRKQKFIKSAGVPPMKDGQTIVAPILELKEAHESFARATLNDLSLLNLDIELMDVHSALREARMSVDPEFTDLNWSPSLPGDPIPTRERKQNDQRDISEVVWPPLYRQLIPRDGENVDLRTARIGDRMYAPMYIDLFPKEIKPFMHLFQRAFSAQIPWRMSFMIESGALSTIAIKSQLAAILSFASAQNPLIHDANNLLRNIDTASDDAVVRLKVNLATWAPLNKESLLRTRAAELAKAVQGWGNCEVAEISGDPYGATISSAVGINVNSVATPSVAPLSDVVYMLPIVRPSSPWSKGAMLFRSPDGKPWPYQPCSSQQTTWIDLIYARPGSGKSVLSNAMNLALCLSAGIARLPRIAIIDIGPSSSGLISLLQGALPENKKHQALYKRLRMTTEFAINPFDTQLGCRKPTPLNRSFLVNFLTLLATPLGQEKPYDGITDMAGMVVDELYKDKHDEAGPNRYTPNIEPTVDKLLTHIDFVSDAHTSWWEVTDALFQAGYPHEAMLAQRFAMPTLADVVSISRGSQFEDLYGDVKAPTGEPIINAFNRMISSAVREYPIIAQITQFDLGDARVVSLDLDEVAKTGGEAADRQTAVMYMLGRYILGRDFYLTQDNLADMPEAYRDFHYQRITEIREDPKRIVMDEFHRTSRAQAVRDQVIVDMREGRKWKVQVSLLSQALEDFDSIMVDFATSIFIMDAGPAQTVEKTAKVFGLSETSKLALRQRVHGPRAGGGTFLAQFATKSGLNTQLLTNTLGPIELWSFSTTAEDAAVRDKLYQLLGPTNTRQILAKLYPSGSIVPIVEQRLQEVKEAGDFDEESAGSIISQLVEEIIAKFEQSKQGMTHAQTVQSS